MRNPYYDPRQPHHTPDGFRNLYAPRIAKSLTAILRWRWQAWWLGLPPPPRQPTPVMTPQLARLKTNPARVDDPTARAGLVQPSATWIGHATVLMQCGGLNVLTDPLFSQRASPVSWLGPQRVVPPGIALEDLPPIDVVLISHNHYDHLDYRSVIRLQTRSAGQTLFLVPLGLKALLQTWGITHVIEQDWWQIHRHQNVEFQLVPVQHWSARGLHDRNTALWGGWAVFAPDLRWYFSGDAGYSRCFADTCDRLAWRIRDGALFDLALLAIGAYEPRWFMREQHMNPAEAVQAHNDLAARRSIAIHWGVFPLTDEPLDQPPRDLMAARAAAALTDADFSLLQIGETWWPADTPG